MLHKESDTDGEYKEPKGYDRGGWEIHFRRHLDSLSFPELLSQTEIYLNLFRRDPSAIQEYRLCIELLDRIAFLGIYGASFSFKDNKIEIFFEDHLFYFPIQLESGAGRDIHCRANGIEHRHRAEADPYAKKRIETCGRIIETGDIDIGFTILLEYYGYEGRKSHDDVPLATVLDLDVVKNAIDSVDVCELTQYGWNETSFLNSIHSSQSEGTLLTKVLQAYHNGNQTDIIQLSTTLGRILGKIAARTSSLSSEEAAFLSACGILDIPKIKEVFDTKVQEAVEARWLGLSFDPLKDMRVKALYEFTRYAVDDAVDLRMDMQWADYIDSSNFRLDMTRGNDPTIFRSGHLSGIAEHEARAAGYEPGIYCGVLGAFYDWSTNQKAIIRNMPLKHADSITGRGEAILMCKGLKVKKLSEDKHGYKGINFIYQGFDASASEVIPYDDPEDSDVVYDDISFLEMFIPARFLAVFQEYYPEATIVQKRVQVVTGQQRLEHISLPFIVLPAEARNNLVKVELLKQATGVYNVVIT